MIKISKGILGLLFVAGLMFGCSDYVQDVDKPIASASDTEVNTPQDLIPFQVGLQSLFSQVAAENGVNNGGISDELFFDTDVQGATFPQFAQIDAALVGVLVPGNNSVQNQWRSLTQCRLLADTLVVRALGLEYEDAADSALQGPALFYGYFFGAAVRLMMCDNFSLTNTDEGGGVVEGNGPFVPSAQLRLDAIALLDEAMKYGNPTQVAQCNTLRARAYLYLGDFVNAETAATSGMPAGSPPVQALFNLVTQNNWYNDAGMGRSQYMADARFKAYVDSTPSEANRIPLYLHPSRSGTEYWQQNKYDAQDAPYNYMTWQENHLMLAELAIRNNENATALDFVNAVRASHNVVELTDEQIQSDFGGDYLEMIYVERDKELCFTGMRAMDQVRFDKWHLDPAATWKRPSRSCARPYRGSTDLPCRTHRNSTSDPTSP